MKLSIKSTFSAALFWAAILLTIVSAIAQGQPFPFTLSLKLEGDKVTGSSNSQLGVGNITTGTWKEGKLAVVLDGNITLVATMIEDKLSGDYDFAGQSSGKWVAVKKK